MEWSFHLDCKKLMKTRKGICRIVENVFIKEDYRGGNGVETKYIDPFVEAIQYIFQQFGMSSQSGEPKPTENPFSGKDVYTVIGVTGELRGQVYLGLSKDTSLGVVSAMMGGMPIAELDEMGQSALAELFNMICGNAMTRFSAEGLTLDITPPSVVIGKELTISSSKVKILSVSFEITGMDPIVLTAGMGK
jgi:chemotaxis protein CheX